ncbi:MAG: transcription termination/antitermination protein NusG [Planctomycetota bacterium]
MAKKWFVLRVQTGRENSVKESLLKRVEANKLQDVVSRVIVPSERVSEIKSGKKRVSERKIYPGYIMVEMEVDEENSRISENAWFVIRETPGIGDFLGSRTAPVPMKDHEVEKILSDVEHKEEAPQVRVGFKRGDNVRIKEGPFENFDGYVEDINPAKGLVKVVVTIFGRATPIELEYWLLEAI